jgi:altronate dehydratase
MAEWATFDFHAVGRLPVPDDNVAIATRRLEAGTIINHEGTTFPIDYTILEGHRFAIRPIAPGEALLSWGLPFGYATVPIVPGSYARNPKILKALATRGLDFALPAEANFRDNPLEAYTLDEANFHPAAQVPIYPDAAERTFPGYRRGGDRGIGTRNHLIILGVTSRVGSWAKALEERFRGQTDGMPNIDGVVAVAHTEGGGADQPNNRELLLRTLAGFIINPNVGAALIVDDGHGPITGREVREWMRAHDYPLDQVLHRFVTLRNSFEADLDLGTALLREWLPQVSAYERTPQPLGGLNIALQCGGSDAFSGISGNPLLAWVARETIRHGGIANLAETDELIGAEEYVLQHVRDLATARRFLATIARFKERVAWHGHTAEGNPSGGNNFRGLYNIALKSIGAAAKKWPDVRLDAVIEYGERALDPGYYFMDSPGNDLESIAGQIASGANLIYFVTGNGSITNFPFVPTIKIVTTTARYDLLSRDMDVNAGEYLDGVPMEELGARTFARTVRVASGERTVGERAGHAQVSIWRDWRQTDYSNLAALQNAPAPAGLPLAARPPAPGDPLADATFTAIQTAPGPRADQIGLVLPTSICSGQIASQIARLLNSRRVGDGKLSRYVALPHTEGCGVSSGPSEQLYTRTLIGYLTNPLVGRALLLEHGCEKTHNDFVKNELRAAGADLNRFGWASIQLDGGIEATTGRVLDWFAATLATEGPRQTTQAGLGALSIALAAHGAVSPALADAYARLGRLVVAAGGTVVVPENSALLAATAFRDALFATPPTGPSLDHGAMAGPGLHIMATPTDHWVETLTGLGATGVEIVLAHVDERPVQAHRLLPVIQIASDPALIARYADDLDLALTPGHDWATAILGVLLSVASREYSPRLNARGNTDFQFTRGLLGVSM